jgi:transposase InsO family protein
MAPEVEARIVEMRRNHPGWGPRTILNKLRRELDIPPSRAAIYRCLVRHRLIQPKPRRRRRDDYKRWERSRSMELWQIDVMGSVLSSGIGVSVVTGIDDHSRFCVIAKVVARATARPVCDALLEALATHGIPEQILTDIQTQLASLNPRIERPTRRGSKGPAPTCRRCLTERSAARLLAC